MIIQQNKLRFQAHKALGENGMMQNLNLNELIKIKLSNKLRFQPQKKLGENARKQNRILRKSDNK